MKRKSFGGIAVHPARFSPMCPTMIKVVLPGRIISSGESTWLKHLNVALQDSLGHVGVYTDSSGTTIALLGLIQDQKEARAVAAYLARVVRKVTGVSSILRQLPNYQAVSRTLAA